MFIHEVCAAFDKANIPYAIVGGYAVALHGAMRGTIHIDIVIHWTLQNLKSAEKILNQMGLVSLLPLDANDLYHFREEYIKKRNLVAWNFYDPKNPINQIDLIITYDLKKWDIKVIETSLGKIKIVGIKSLIAMKKAAGRPQDLEDIKALERLWKK